MTGGRGSFAIFSQVETPYPVRGRLFLRLYARLPEAALYLSGAYQGYDRLSADRPGVGKDGAVNCGEGAHSKLRDRTVVNQGHWDRVFTNIGTPCAPLLWTCIRLRLPGQSPPSYACAAPSSALWGESRSR